MVGTRKNANGIDPDWPTPPEALRRYAETHAKAGRFMESMALGFMAQQVEAYMTGATSLWYPAGTYSTWRPGCDTRYPAFRLIYAHNVRGVAQ